MYRNNLLRIITYQIICKQIIHLHKHSAVTNAHYKISVLCQKLKIVSNMRNISTFKMSNCRVSYLNKNNYDMSPIHN